MVVGAGDHEGEKGVEVGQALEGDSVKRVKVEPLGDKGQAVEKCIEVEATEVGYISEEVMADYIKAFGSKPNGYARERLLSYLNRFYDDVVGSAIEMAGHKQKSVAYAYGILRHRGKAGVRTFDEMVAYAECP